MTRLLKSTGFKIFLCIGLVILLLAGGLIWYLTLPKFHDLTLELGAQMPKMEDFQTKYAIPALSKQMTDEAYIDMRLVGKQTVDFSHGWQKYTVTLTIQDTTKPEVVFRDVTAYIDEVPTAEDFVQSVTDESKFTIALDVPLVPPENYGNATASVTVTDAYGNATSNQCTVHYAWLERQLTLEYGELLTKEALLLRPDKDAHLLDQAVLDEINNAGVGTYTITSVDGDITCVCQVTVEDTVCPELELRNKKVYIGDVVTAEDFIVSATDLSGKVDVKLTSPLDTSAAGKFTLVFEATDINGNVTTKEAVLEVVKDTAGPVFSGMSAMTVEKHSSPDFKAGVKATDSQDGKVTFTCDSSKVNLSKAGTYYAIYSATDSAGNTTTYRRKVTVNYNDEDAMALVQDAADKLPDNDAEALRDYVRDKIRYTHNWGGKDPTKGEPEPDYVYVWYGMKHKSGNCYVHAMVLDYMLKAKGFETKLIWATDKTHYWNMVNINGTWYHIDSTPGTRHTKYSLMNDAQRYETLFIADENRQRDWDRSQWPACP